MSLILAAGSYVHLKRDFITTFCAKIFAKAYIFQNTCRSWQIFYCLWVWEGQQKEREKGKCVHRSFLVWLPETLNYLFWTTGLKVQLICYLQECGSVFRKVQQDGRLRSLGWIAWLICVRHRVSDTWKFQGKIPIKRQLIQD